MNGSNGDQGAGGYRNNWAVCMLAIALSFIYPNAYGAVREWLLARLPDPETPPSSQSIEALVAEAAAGGIQAKQQFAIVYLYEDGWLHGKRVWGCSRLLYGHFCRALAQRGELGERYLKELAQMQTDQLSPNLLGRYQTEYAWRLAHKARPEFSPSNPSCVAARKYLELTIKNELAGSDSHKRSCAARDLAGMFRAGRCAEPDEQRARELFILSGSCPVD